jgi:hypothetical protein
MARLTVTNDDDPKLFIDLEDEGGEGIWDGRCTGCDYTVSDSGTRFNGLSDAVNDAMVHLDHHH